MSEDRPLPPPEPEEGIEEGMASERTDLAWSRSGLSLLACGVAAFRGVPWLDEERGRWVAGVVMLLLGAATWLLGAAQARRRRAPGLARRVARPVDLWPVTAGVIAVGVGAFIIGLVLTPKA